MHPRPRLNLHIYGSNITHESRILKETETIARLGLVDKVYIIGLWEEGLPSEEAVDDRRTILRIKPWSRWLGEGTIPKSLKLAEWMSRIALKFLAQRVAMVNIHYVAGLPTGAFFKVFKGSKLIYDTHELETERHGWGKWRRKLAKAVERLFIPLVDEILVSSPPYAEWYAKAYGKRAHTVLNTPSYAPIRTTNLFRERFGISSDKTIFLYQGAVGTGRRTEEILGAFGNSKDPDKVVVFMGYGPLEGMIKEAAARHPNIFFHPAVKPSEVLHYTASADVGFCIIENTCLSYEFTSPNKMFEYAMAGLPVVVANFGEMKRLIEAHRIGYVLQDSTAGGISELIARVDKAELQTFRENLASFGKIYNWENQEKVLAQVYQKYLPAKK
ncbi:MAG: glycosyltransferase [Chloroflexi bacterium]|nr:glycosyltransferase [Chloroflexota bacterium]